jgi:hypothetical protein
MPQLIVRWQSIMQIHSVGEVLNLVLEFAN